MVMERPVAEGAGERWNSVDVSRRSLKNMLTIFYFFIFYIDFLNIDREYGLKFRLR